ncbi:MAG: hypothetical protein HYT08_04095 [Candidatus Levybacteria bacterium]|nr:hypothetical protein [Candidatus Levybacteria bacterium]
MHEKLHSIVHNGRIFVDAAWGAATRRSILRSGLETYLKKVNRKPESSYNPDDEIILREFFPRISQAVKEKNHSRQSLLTLPWSTQKIELHRLAKAIIAFSDDHGKETVPEFFPVEEMFQFLNEVRCQFQQTGKQLTLINQLDIALRQTDNHPTAAAILTSVSYRALRNCDRRIDPRLSFAIDSDTESITMMDIARSTADFAMADKRDPLGNTYHWRSQFSFVMTSPLFKTDSPTQVNAYNTAFHFGPELTRGIRNKLLGMPLAAGDHKDVDRQGMRIGRGIGSLVISRLCK